MITWSFGVAPVIQVKLLSVKFISKSWCLALNYYKNLNNDYFNPKKKCTWFKQYSKYRFIIHFRVLKNKQHEGKVNTTENVTEFVDNECGIIKTNGSTVAIIVTLTVLLVIVSAVLIIVVIICYKNMKRRDRQNRYGKSLLIIASSVLWLLYNRYIIIWIAILSCFFNSLGILLLLCYFRRFINMWPQNGLHFTY